MHTICMLYLLKFGGVAIKIIVFEEIWRFSRSQGCKLRTAERLFMLEGDEVDSVVVHFAELLMNERNFTTF